MMREFALTLSCDNRPGIVVRVASVIEAMDGDIFEAQQFDDPDTGRFFMRVLFRTGLPLEVDQVRVRLRPVSEALGMAMRVRDRSIPSRLLVLASRSDHCLANIVSEVRGGRLSASIAGVVANHPRETFAAVPLGDMPFHHLPVTPDTRAEQEARIAALIDELDIDLVVLARYMQILSDDFAAKLAGRCINIHHGFLPSFKGARPYHQAYDRGVKLIGATAHYVTAQLDEGPIIEQDVERITHADMPETLIRKGRDIERRVLTRALRWHCDDRVMLNGAKTVVFRD